MDIFVNFLWNVKYYIIWQLWQMSNVFDTSYKVDFKYFSYIFDSYYKNVQRLDSFNACNTLVKSRTLTFLTMAVIKIADTAFIIAIQIVTLLVF